MSIRVEKEFEVDQDPREVWDFLLDPRRVVQCIPGAEIAEQVDDRVWAGEIGVELGPFGVTFAGRIRFDRIDEQNLEVEMTGSGRDEKGRGRVSMRMASRLARRDGGGTRVSVRQEIDMEGRLVRFGRGPILRGVADVMFGRFTRCVTRKLAGG